VRTGSSFGLSYLAALALGPLVLLPGCLSTTLYETAEVCRPGKAEFTVAATPWFWRAESSRFVFEEWNRPGPELSVRAGLFENLGVGLRLIPALGVCVTAKYQFLRDPVDVSVTAAGYTYAFGAMDAGGRYAGAYGGVIASNERERSLPFSLQALLRCERADVGGFRFSYRSGALFGVVGAGVPILLPASGPGALRIHPAASVNVPLAWRYWDWTEPGYHGYDPYVMLPPKQADDWRGVVTLDLGVALSYVSGRR
jgi:hypothetical protein